MTVSLQSSLSEAKIGYVPISSDLSAPGDRRRFPYYARARGIKFEIADPAKEYDVVIITARADISVWSRYPKGKIVYELIDSYLSIPRHNIKGRLRGLFKFLSRQSRYLQLNHWKAIEAMCSRADAVVCTTAEQEGEIRKFCKNVFKILDFQLEVAHREKCDYKIGENIKIVWEGLPQTLGSFKKIKPVLEALVAKYNLEVHIITDSHYYQYLGAYGKRNTATQIKKTVPGAYFHEWNQKDYADIIASSDFAIIPLDLDDLFSAGKPENKLLLFWRMGIPVVCSASPAYVRTMRAVGLNLTASNNDEWFRLLEHLIVDENARQTAGRLGYDYVKENCSEMSYIAQWDNVFSSIGFAFCNHNK